MVNNLHPVESRPFSMVVLLLVKVHFSTMACWTHTKKKKENVPGTFLKCWKLCKKFMAKKGENFGY